MKAIIYGCLSKKGDDDESIESQVKKVRELEVARGSSAAPGGQAMRAAIGLLAVLALVGCSTPGSSPSESDIESYCHKHPQSNFWRDYDGCVTWNEANR